MAVNVVPEKVEKLNNKILPNAIITNCFDDCLKNVEDKVYSGIFFRRD